MSELGEITLPDIGQEQIEEVIRLGEIIVEGRFVDASNATLFAYARHQEINVPVIYKPIAGERPLWDFPDGNLASREVAAYLLAKKIGLSLVPYTILRDGPFGVGSVQQWVAVDDQVDVVDFVQSSPPTLRTLTLFDAMINNTDRKFGHILIDSSGSVYGCDHGVCFHADNKLRTVLWNWSGDTFTPSERELLDSALLACDEIGDLPALLTGEEILALKQRISTLIENGKFPEPSLDWPAVPFPPY